MKRVLPFVFEQTPQELLEKVAVSLFKQGVPAMHGKNCAYRGANNTKCAIGHCIPDNVYGKDLENNDISNLVALKGFAFRYSETKSLAFHLQVVHDCRTNETRGFDLQSLMLSFRDCANSYDLKITKPILAAYREARNVRSNNS